MSPQMSTFFSCYLQRVHLYGPLYLTPSGVTRPLHRRLRPSTVTGPFAPVMGLFPPVPLPR